jgi:hypothetical protein
MRGHDEAQKMRQPINVLLLALLVADWLHLSQQLNLGKSTELTDWLMFII